MREDLFSEMRKIKPYSLHRHVWDGVFWNQLVDELGMPEELDEQERGKANEPASPGGSWTIIASVFGCSWCKFN